MLAFVVAVGLNHLFAIKSRSGDQQSATWRVAVSVRRQLSAVTAQKTRASIEWVRKGFCLWGRRGLAQHCAHYRSRHTRRQNVAKQCCCSPRQATNPCHTSPTHAGRSLLPTGAWERGQLLKPFDRKKSSIGEGKGEGWGQIRD